MDNMPVKSLGERRVRVDFNPSNSNNVTEFKTMVAKVINYLNNQPFKEEWDKDHDHYRLKNIAITKLEEAAMFGVKSLTP